MRLTLTLRRANGPDADIVVTADAAATIGSLARAICEADPLVAAPRAAGAWQGTLRVLDGSGNNSGIGGGRLDAEAVVGDSPLASGTVVALAYPGAGVELGAGVEPGAGGAAGEGAAARDAPVAVIRVISGPDAGAEFRLAVGTRYLGRGDGADVRLSDPLVSTSHARIDVAPGCIRVVDLNSATGIEVDGGAVPRVEVTGAATLTVGETEIEVSLLAGRAAAEPEGRVVFTRSPRIERRYPGRQLTGPDLPSEVEEAPFPYLAMVAPMLTGGVMYAATQRPASLIFVAIAPVLMVFTWLVSRGQRRRRRRRAAGKFATQLSALTTELDREAAAERATRLREVPSTREVYADALALGPLLWTRRPEHWQFLMLRLGVGTLPSRTTVSAAGEGAALPEYLESYRTAVAPYENVAGVPIVESLAAAGALGVVGSRPVAGDIARGILTQLVGLHSPAELVVTAIVGHAWTPEFEWLKWLPHTASAQSPIAVPHLADSEATGGALLAAIEGIIAARGTHGATPDARGATAMARSAIDAGAGVGNDGGSDFPPPMPLPAIVLILSDDAPVERARLVQVAERAADAGVFPLWVSSSVRGLPAVARTFIDVTAVTAATGTSGTTAGRVGFVRLGTEFVAAEIDTVTRAEATRLGRRLASVEDAGALTIDVSDVPRSVSLVTLLGAGLCTDAGAAIERWRQNDSIHDRSGAPPTRSPRSGRLRAIVGQGAQDAMHLDLRAQGPHALVGGTTGSGKSEFLQAWVLGMAAEYSPDRVTFLFVDYKGGAAFADCVSLPHAVGLVTDLSPHLVRRALTSLRAELHHREHLLNRKKAKDLLELERRGDPESPPALVLVVDEFAALVGDVPEFVDGVVDIAQRGRSLGIHLVLATQRPAGVIRDNLRANTTLRVALRMADDSDSVDVVGDRLAGAFDPSLPGRAIARTGPGRLTLFQSGYAGGHTIAEVVEPSIEISELRFGARVTWERPPVAQEAGDSDLGPTDQARLVATLASAASAANIPAPRRPWLDELGKAYELTGLRQLTDSELVLGVRDVPEHQVQDEVSFRPDIDGSLAVFGTGGSGKSVVLRTLACAAGITPHGGPVDVYGLDFGTGALRMLEVLPHVGAVISGDDPERVARLLRTMRDIADDRAQRYSAANAGTIVDYRRLANAPDEARILLLVDNFPSFRAEFEHGVGRAAWYGVFQQLVSEGRALGIHVAMTADRPGSVPTTLSSSIQRRVVLRLADESSYVLLDAPSDVLGASSPPGRAVIDGFETQVAVIGGTSSVLGQSKAIAALSATIAGSGRRPAPPIGALGREIAYASLPDVVRGNPLLGVADDTLEPIGFETEGAFVLAGPPASGRSTALVTMIRGIDAALPNARRYYFGAARSRLGAAAGWEATARTPEDVARLARELCATIAESAFIDQPATRRVVVVIEQIGDFLQTPADGPLVELIRQVKRAGHFVLAEADTQTWASSWPLFAEMKAGRAGVLLQPEPIEGETVFRTSLPRSNRADFPTGRGYLIHRGRAVRVQLPMA